MKRLTLTLTIFLAVLTGTKAWATGGTLTGEGTSANPYLISDLADWNSFASMLNSGVTANDYDDKYYKLTADIGTAENPVTTMASEDYYIPFRGNFNGNGHTITVALTRDTNPGGNEHTQGIALFHYVDGGCNIHDLTVTGTINTTCKFAAGFISYITSPANSEDVKVVSINRCRSSVVITSTVEGDATSAGFVAISKTRVNLVLNNCLFDGAFVSSTGTQFCGMVGYQDNNGNTNILNSLVKPDADAMSLTAENGNHYTFCRYSGGCFGTFHNYYTTAIGTAQGTAVGEMSSQDLKDNLGAAWLVDDSGEVVPYAISYHYTMIDNYTVYECNVPGNIELGYGDVGYANLVDGNKASRWVARPSNWTPFTINFYSQVSFVPKGYVFTSSHLIQNNPKHTPTEWKLMGKKSDGTWEVIDEHSAQQSNYPYTLNSADKVYLMTDNTETYQDFQLQIIDVKGKDGNNQKAFEMGEFQLFGILNNNDLSNACIDGVQSYYTYTGEPIPVDYTVTDYNGNVLTEGVDYTQEIIPSESVQDMQPYTLTITGTGTETSGYFGTQSVDFTVTGNTGLSMNYLIPESTIGHYYVDLPKRGQRNIDLTHFAPPFKVYDDGGKNRKYSASCTEELRVTASEGYLLQVSGTVDLGEDTFMKVYDGGDSESPLLMTDDYLGNFDENIGVHITTGPLLKISFSTGPGITLNDRREGLNLTVIPVPANTNSDITISNPTPDLGSVAASVAGTSVTSATVLDLVTLTATPAEGYLINDFSVTDAYGNPVTVEGAWYTNNTGTFIMPGSAVTVIPHFVPVNVALPNEPIQLSVNMPKRSENAADAKVISVPADVHYFKVYDNGGKDGDYSYNSNGYLLLVAPENQQIKLGGQLDVSPDVFLQVYDGNTTDHPLGREYDYTYPTIDILTSSGNQMLIHFENRDSYLGTDSGMNLTAEVFNQSTEFGFTVAESDYGTVTPASGNVKAGTTVELTFTPDTGSTGYRPLGFTTNVPAVLVEGGWYSNNVMNFTMPAYNDLVITPHYTDAVTAEDGLYVNMPRKNTYAAPKMVNFPDGVSSFKVYDHAGPTAVYGLLCDGYMILSAPENKKILLTGTVMTERGCDYLEIYDGNTTETLIGSYGNYHYVSPGTYEGQDIGEVRSSGQYLLLHFVSNGYGNYDGINIKAELVTDPNLPTAFSGFTATAGQDGNSDPSYSSNWHNLVDCDMLGYGWVTHSSVNSGFQTNYVEFEHTEAFIPQAYYLVTGNDTEDHPNRLPKSWTLKGKLHSDDDWTIITSVTNDSQLRPVNRFTTEFLLNEINQAFRYFRFEVTEVQGYEYGGHGENVYVMELNELYFRGLHAGGMKYQLEYATVEGVEPRYVYTGSTIPVPYTVKDAGGALLTEGEQYNAAFSPSPVKVAGDYTLTISAKDGSGYTGNKTLHFKVTDYPMNVDADEDYDSPDQLGYYYVNMPHSGTTTVDFTHPAGFTKSIKIYDDGGKSANYGISCDGYLLLEAPEGYVLQLAGTVTCNLSDDYLQVFNGNEATSANQLGKAKYGNTAGENIGTMTTSGQQMLLRFVSNSPNTFSGLNLTLDLVNASEARDIYFTDFIGGTATASPNPTTIGTIVTLTPAPAPGYLLKEFTAKDAYEHDLAVTGAWYNDGTATFTMPANEATVMPKFTHRRSYLGGLYINMPKENTTYDNPVVANIPLGVSSFKLYDDGGQYSSYTPNCEGFLRVVAPEGYVLRVKGTAQMFGAGAPALHIYHDNTVDDYAGHNETQTPVNLTTAGNQMLVQFSPSSNNNGQYYGLDLTVTIMKLKDQCWAGNGSSAEPYEISDMDGLELLATLSETDDFAGTYFKLTDDIGTADDPFRKVIADNENKPFRGVFNGDGHTITMALSNLNPYTGNDEAEQGTALFHYAGDGCQISNLTIDGSITTANKFAGGFIAYVKAGESNSPKTITLDNCHSGVEITSTKSGDNTTGGIVGLVKEYVNLSLNRCLFDGAFVSDQGTQFSGFVGYVGNHVNTTITNGIVVVDPTRLGNPNGNHFTFCRYNNNSAPVFSGNNFHYTALGTAQGIKVYKLTLPIGVTAIRDAIGTSGNGDAPYYADGCLVNDIPYYTGDNQVTIGPSTSFVITSAVVNYGEISWGANPNGDGTFWFNMPAEDVTVTAAMGKQFTVEGYGDSTESDHWVFLAVPTVEDVAISTTTGIIVVPESNYDLYRFNQSAEQEWENSKSHWNDPVDPFRTLHHGSGYLYARKETTTLTFAGTFNWTEPQEVNLSYDPDAALSGWNLVGNPFATEAYVDRPYYKLNAAGSDIVPVERFWEVEVPACTGVLVHARNADDDKASFTRTEPQLRAKREGGLLLTLTKVEARSEEEHDRAIVSFNENLELEKFNFNAEHAKLFIRQDDKSYAIVYSEKTGEVPLSFKAVKEGAYTLAVRPVFAQMEYMHLIDTQTGADVDLLTTPVYSFTSQAGSFDNRFRLVFSVCGIDENGSSTGSESFAYIDANGNLIVNAGPSTGSGTSILQVFDVLGRQHISKELSTVNSQLSTLNFPSGVYVLRLINGDSVRTQKIVVK